MRYLTTWRTFLRTRHQHGSGARLLLNIGGTTPGATRKMIQHARETGRIDDESYVLRMDALRELSTAYDHTAYIKRVRKPRAWQELREVEA